MKTRFAISILLMGAVFAYAALAIEPLSSSAGWVVGFGIAAVVVAVSAWVGSGLLTCALAIPVGYFGALIAGAGDAAGDIDLLPAELPVVLIVAAAVGVGLRESWTALGRRRLGRA